MTDTDLQTAAQTSKAWPFEEARKLLKRYPQGKAKDGQDVPVLFETGYGPSGLPHIGTFQEVLRTTLVRRAYEVLTGKPTRLVAFSDDMDGLRKVPDNVPNKEMLAEHLGKPLSRIPDPFGTHESFAHHNNAMLRASSTSSASITNSSRPATATIRANSTRRCAACCAITTRSWASCFPLCARSAARPIRRSCPSAQERDRASGAHRGGRCRGRPDPFRG
jgi:hypothetical protein